MARADGRTVIISQARMTSTRLPGKVLMEAAGRPLLAWHLERLKRSVRADVVALATTTNADDDPVAALAAALGVAVFRGDEHDVLGRFAGCARMVGAVGDDDVVVRVTADCPLIDPALIDALLDRLAQEAEVDYVNIDSNRFPRGLDAEAFRASVLYTAAAEAGEGFEREHVTPFIYRHPERFRLGAPLVPETPLPAYRWCVDEADDLELVRRILVEVAAQGDGFGWQDCCSVLTRHPDWADINRAVAQRKLPQVETV